MEYLTKVLGIKVRYLEDNFDVLPNYINSRYKLQMVKIDNVQAIFLYPNTNLEQLKILKTHILRIKKEYSFPVVLILKKISFRQKEYLIKERIAFIVENKQIYLPFMATYLQDKCDAEAINLDKILPSTQALL